VIGQESKETQINARVFAGQASNVFSARPNLSNLVPQNGVLQTIELDWEGQVSCPTRRLQESGE
jgi:hypothetical protein